MGRSFAEKIDRRDITIGVIGLGYVGLPLVLAFCREGFRVLGFDIDEHKTKQLAAGKSYIKHICSDEICEINRLGRFEATTDYLRMSEADALLICVPTPLTPQREPDLSFVIATAEAIRAGLRKEQLVILESTTYPGTTREVLLPVLESSGLKEGEDFFVAYSPEREDPGNKQFSTTGIPKIVGGCSAESRIRAAHLYAQIVPRVVEVTSADTAEAVKLTENIFRAVNIALVNELKVVFQRMGIDVWEVVDAAKTKPFGYMPFYPGPGLGGHCIPIDPFYLTWKAREYGCSTRFIELAGEINVGMPDYVIRRLMDALNERGKSVKNSRVLVMGVAYKNDVDDLRESPSLVLMEELIRYGAQVSYHDPYVESIKETRSHPALSGMRSVSLNDATLSACDAVLIATAHSEIDYAMVVEHAALVVDTRNAAARAGAPLTKVVKA
ncbi:MAG: nucleotide sugar dehydrogenase [Candidatus Hydrogenedentes bacterium]|nr:nucleotide sugar dehydrogenase [Candidatus Hydrogenedentota bacterium]